MAKTEQIGILLKYTTEDNVLSMDFVMSFVIDLLKQLFSWKLKYLYNTFPIIQKVQISNNIMLESKVWQAVKSNLLKDIY